MFDQLKNLKDMASMMGNASELREKFMQLQAELAQKTVDAEAGAGAVRVTVNGKLEVQRVELDPAMLSTLAGGGGDADREMVEELIVAATNAAMQKAHALIREQMGQLTGGMNIPGLDGLLGAG